MDELGQAAGAVALRAGSGYLTGIIPIAERHACSREVTGVIPRQLGQIDRLGNLAVQILDGVVQQLDDVLRVVGEGARIFLGSLVVVGGL